MVNNCPVAKGCEELIKRVHTCTSCGYTGADVLYYRAHIGGVGDCEDIIACSDIDACQRRQHGKYYRERSNSLSQMERAGLANPPEGVRQVKFVIARKRDQVFEAIKTMTLIAPDVKITEIGK